MTEPRNFHAEIKGPVDGNVNIVQAGVLKAETITFSASAKELLGHIEQAQQHLVLSRRTEQRTALLVSVLHEALIRAFQLIGRLAAERDERLPEAQEKHRRTEGQLDRAEVDHLRAVALCHTLGRRVVTLQQRLLAQEPSAAAQLRVAEDLTPSPADILDDLETGLDRIDQLLAAEEETLARITGDAEAAQARLADDDDQSTGPRIIETVGASEAATTVGATGVLRAVRTVEAADGMPAARLAVPAPDQAAQAAKLRDIVLNTSINVEHRLKAASKLARHGSEYRSIAAVGLRLIIADSGLKSTDHMAAIYRLSLLAPEFRTESVALLDQRMRSDPDTVIRIFASAQLAELDPDSKDRCVSYLREVTTGDDIPAVRNIAAARWWNTAPQDRAEIVAALRQIAAADGLAESTASDAHRLIEEIETDPYYTESP